MFLRYILWLFAFSFSLFALCGCGETIDLYGESRMQTAEPVQEREQPDDNPHRNPKPAKKGKTPEKPSYQSDLNADGVFMIVPPVALNPKNVQAAPDPQIITIDFQKQFDWMPVQVIVNGKVILDERLKTNDVGFADSVSFHYDEPPARFTLAFPTMGARETFSVDPDKGRFLGISYVGGQLKLDLQEGPFFYEKH